MASRRPRIRIVLDFDGTITKEDTTAVIGSRCLAKARELADANVPETKLPKPMSYYSDQYMREYKEWKDSNPWPEDKRRTVSDEVKYLSQSKHVDKASYRRVRDAILGVPGGIGNLVQDEHQRNDFMATAGHEAVRSGDVQVRDPVALKELMTRADFWSIVSVSWSRRFILGVLLEAGLVGENEIEEVAQRVWCNEILDLTQTAKGAPPFLITAEDKLDTLRSVMGGWSNEYDSSEMSSSVGNHAGSKDQGKSITLYVGDSSTDLGCLAGPAVGMYMSEKNPAEDPLIKTFERLGNNCETASDLPSGTKSNQVFGTPGRRVYTVTNFGDINKWITKLDEAYGFDTT